MPILCVYIFGWIQTVAAEKVPVQNGVESRLEENLHTIRLQHARPGLRCMLRASGETPRAMKPAAAVQWQSLGMGPLLPVGILKEVQKPFEYAASSPVFRQSAGCRLDFSLNPPGNYGAFLLGSGKLGRSGLWFETADSSHRAGAWLDIASAELFRLSACLYASLLPELSREDSEEGALQTRYPVRVQGRRFTTCALALQLSEADNKCSLLSAIMCSPAGEAALFGRTYLQLGVGRSGEPLYWRVCMLGRWISNCFTDAWGELPEEKASLQGILTVGAGRKGINIEGAVSRDKAAPVPERYIACERQGSMQLFCGFLCFDGRAGCEREWSFDEEAELKVESSCEAEIEASGASWKAAAISGCSTSGETADIEYRQRFKYQAEAGRWKLSGVFDLQDSLSLQSGYFRCEYKHEYEPKCNELCLWAKLGWELGSTGGFATPLSIGMRLRHSEVQ